jgi:hypothetical protein
LLHLTNPEEQVGGQDLSTFYRLVIREALTAGVLVVTPTFPIFTVVAAAKMESVTTRQMPFQSAALILIFTPLDVLRQQSYTFMFDPLGANLPQSGTTRVLTINKSQQNAIHGS